MSTDRLERRLPEVLTELSLPRVPDYVDNLLSRTERMPQRPGWSFLERWIPVSTLTSALPATRRPSLRPLVVIAILVAVVVASIAVYFGSERRLPPPFGLARNGLVVTTSAAGDLVSVDPATEASRTLVAGPNVCCADVSPDGQRLSFLKIDPGTGDPAGVALANVDGSVIRDLDPETVRSLEWAEWAPASDRLLIVNAARTAVVDVATGDVTPISVPFSVKRASWIGTTGDMLLTNLVGDTPPNGSTLRVYRLAAGATTGATEVATIENVIDAPLVSPDGSKFLYFIWGPEQRLQGRIHVFDFATGVDTAVTSEEAQAPADLTEWENAVWSPDGSLIAAELYSVTDSRIAVIPASGGEPVILGPSFQEMSGGTAIQFSPDGASLLVTYRYDSLTYLIPVSGGEGRRVPWAPTEEIDWQRLAP